MSVTTRAKGVYHGTKKVVGGTVGAAQKTGEAVAWTGRETKRTWFKLGSIATFLADSVPLAATGVAAVNLVTRATKHVDFFPHLPADALSNVIDSGHNHAVSMLDSSNAVSQAGGVLVGAETTAAHLADMAGAPGEVVGGFVGDLFDGRELGAEIGGGATEAVVAVAAGRAAWKLGRTAAGIWPSKPTPTPGH